MPSNSILTCTCFFTVYVILALPIAGTLLPLPRLKHWPLKFAEVAIKTAFFVSLAPMLTHLTGGEETSVTSAWWLILQSFEISASFKFDAYTIFFTPIALYVSWSILQFTSWYMHADPDMNKFCKFLLMFLLSMLILVSANNMFQLFIAWEAVGILSFMLIGWWFGRTNANIAALQAVVYNRIGDIGLIFAIAWAAFNLNSWDMQHILHFPQADNYPPLLFGLILAATGKSAQFGLHPWLPAAMEGPTPVSALLHSSTMVVAGIFLLIRFSPLLESNQAALKMCLCLGALTTLFTAMCALTQSDIKKVIAFSTSSQLGLMMVAIGLAQPQLAFFHICTHAFFKAMLFLCSGSIIHSLADEQDIRKMGGLQDLMPTTTACMMIGSLALTGTPFLAGFFSKDAIIESLTSSALNAWALILTIIATSFTAVYSLRLIFYVALSTPRFPTWLAVNEETPAVVNPLKRLSLGSIVAGLLIISNISPLKTQTLTMPLHLKLIALAVSILGLLAAIEIAHSSEAQYNFNLPKNSLLFSALLGFFQSVAHFSLPLAKMKVGQSIATKLVDQVWLEQMGPKTSAAVSQSTSPLLSFFQQGSIKVFFAIFAHTLLVLIALTLAKTLNS